MGIASTPAYWTNKKCRPPGQAVSQFSLSQAPRGFAARFRDFAAFLSTKPPSYASYINLKYFIVT